MQSIVRKRPSVSVIPSFLVVPHYCPCSLQDNLTILAPDSESEED